MHNNSKFEKRLPNAYCKPGTLLRTQKCLIVERPVTERARHRLGEVNWSLLPPGPGQAAWRRCELRKDPKGPFFPAAPSASRAGAESGYAGARGLDLGRPAKHYNSLHQDPALPKPSSSGFQSVILDGTPPRTQRDRNTKVSASPWTDLGPGTWDRPPAGREHTVPAGGPAARSGPRARVWSFPSPQILGPAVPLFTAGVTSHVIRGWQLLSEMQGRSTCPMGDNPNTSHAAVSTG